MARRPSLDQHRYAIRSEHIPSIILISCLFELSALTVVAPTGAQALGTATTAYAPVLDNLYLRMVLEWNQTW